MIVSNKKLGPCKLFNIENLLLLCLSIELFNSHHYILIVLFFWLFYKGKINGQTINKEFVFLTIWSLVYWLFTTYSMWSVLQAPTWIIAFIVGYSLVNNDIDVIRILLIIAIGYGLEGLLTVFLSSGFEQMLVAGDASADRAVDGFWGGVRSFSALNVSFYLFSALLVFILSNKEIKFPFKILACLFELGFVFVSLRIAMRSSLLFCPIIFLSTFWVLFKNRSNKKAVFGIIAVLGIIVFLFESDFYGVRSIFENSSLFFRLAEQTDGGVGVNNSRFEYHMQFWEIWTEDIWGGLCRKVGHYFHNVWMDIFGYSGIISAFLFIIVTIQFISNFVYVYRRTNINERMVHFGTFLAFMLPFYMDPMLWAAPAYFVFFCMYCGILSKRRCQISHRNRLL